jgi:hypothetical protein
MALLSCAVGGPCRTIVAAGVGPAYGTETYEDAVFLLQLCEAARTVTCAAEIDARSLMRREMDTIRMKYEHSLLMGQEAIARSKEVCTNACAFRTCSVCVYTCVCVCVCVCLCASVRAHVVTNLPQVSSLTQWPRCCAGNVDSCCFTT